MEKQRSRTPRKKPGNSWKPHWWKLAGLLAVCACIAGIFIFYHKAPTSSSSVADWVKQQDFDPLTPFRSDFMPGTLLSVGKYRDRVAMESAAFLDGNTQLVSRAKLPNVALDLKLNANVTAEGGGSKFTGAEDLKAVLELSNIELLTLPLDRVRDRVKGNARIEGALANNPANLFVILEALQVGTLRLTFNDARKAAAKAQSVNEWLRATFGLSAALDQSGTIQSNAALILGTRLARLSEASTALGGSSREARADKVASSDLQRFRAEVAPRVGRLYSNFEIFGLVMALGNYPARSRRAGGELPDAVRTAEMVSADLQRLLPAADSDHIKVMTSNELSPRAFDPTRRLSRSDLLAGIHDFVQDVKKRSDPQRQTLIVFYFFGHGLADGISKSVFLVPEQFIDNESKPVADVGDRLINVADITRQFAEVTDHAIILADACRAHADEAKELIDTWKGGLQQGSDVGGILNALQFASGIYGPTPILFASKDGTAADTVKYPPGDAQARTGPLAAKLRVVLDKVDADGGGLALGDLVRAFETPTPSTKDLAPEEAAKVRGYTFFRADFLEQFGKAVVVSADPVSVLPRAHAFLPPGWGLESREGQQLGELRRSGATASQLQSVPTRENIQELVWAPGIGLAAVDEANRVWIRNGEKWARFQENLPIVRIGFDENYGLLLYQWDERILYGFRSGKLAPVYRDFFSEFLGTSAGAGTVLARPLDGGLIALLYAENGEMREVTRVAAPSVFDAARDSRDRLWFTTAEGLSVNDGTKTSAVRTRLWKPRTIAAVKDALFVWSEDGQMLYRLNATSGLTESLDLRDVGFGDVFIRREDTRTMAMSGPSTAFFAFGSDVVRLDLRDARWLIMSRQPFVPA